MVDRNPWTSVTLARALAWLSKECNGDPIRMADLDRAALAVVRRRKGRALRDALVAAGRLERGTARGRTADYRLVEVVEIEVEVDVASPDDDADPSTGGPSSGGPAALLWVALALAAWA
jgi:hypothetical protein